MPNFQITIKDQKSHDSFMELARTKDQYLFDEVAIKTIKYETLGVTLDFTYTRHGVTLKDLNPITVAPADFAKARAEAEGKKENFCNTKLVLRLFSEGARQFNERSRTVEEDFLKDLAFLEDLK